MSVCACEEPVAHIELPISQTGLPFESPANLLPAENTDGDVPIRDFKCYWIRSHYYYVLLLGNGLGTGVSESISFAYATSSSSAPEGRRC